MIFIHEYILSFVSRKHYFTSQVFESLFYLLISWGLSKRVQHGEIEVLRIATPMFNDALSFAEDLTSMNTQLP